MKSQKAKITGYKIKNSKKKGYKELTFTVKWTAQWNVKSGEVHKMVKNRNTDNTLGGIFYCAVVDYNTGKDLEVKNKQKVTAESDVDVVAIVRRNRKELQEKLKNVWDISADMELDYDVIISPTVLPYEEFEIYKDIIPYYRSIYMEGVELSA